MFQNHNSMLAIKNILLFVLAVSMIMSMSGCASKSVTSETRTEESKVTETVVETTQETAETLDPSYYQLLDNVFVDLANGINKTTIKRCREYLAKTPFHYEILEESTLIRVSGNNGETVEIYFYPMSLEPSDKDIINLVSYKRGQCEGTASDLLLSGKTVFEIIDSSSGNKVEKVSNLDEIVDYFNAQKED